MNRLPAIVRQHLAALRILIVFTVICGVIYPGVVFGVSQLAFHKQANGSLVSYDGRIVGSSLLCQEFVDAKGNPLAQWFQPRPSDAIVSGDKGDYGCDPLYSSASNLGPSNPTEIADIKAMQKEIEAFDKVSASQIPADAVTASASGLDPDITPANAQIQAARVAATRHLPLSTVLDLIAKNTKGRDIGVLGEPAVNVLTLNIALAELPGQAAYNTLGS
jgi:K+-transporting ATPase ATPase C chain